MEPQDEEIKKLLEQHIRIANYVDSDYCGSVSVDLLQKTIDLINRQQAAIEKFKNEIKEADQLFSEGSFYYGLAIVARLAKEIERGEQNV